MENVKAMAINDMCPNGCTGGENGCYCDGLHEKSSEYSWEQFKLDFRYFSLTRSLVFTPVYLKSYNDQLLIKK